MGYVWKNRKSELENDRQSTIDQAQNAIDVYMPQLEKQQATAEAARQARISMTENDRRDFEANTLPKKQAEWISGLTINRFWTTWQSPQPSSANATNGIELQIDDDAAILASGGPIATTNYTVTIPIKSTNISGVMLEALTHDSLVGFGPGLNKDGNFIVTEFEVSHALAENPETIVKAKLVDAKADHNQNTFDVKNSINGNLNRNDKGWAVGGQTRQPHWARFKLSEPLFFDEAGGTLIIKIVCAYSNGAYPLGRFRIWTTDSPEPLDLGLPVQITKILGQSPSLRSPEQNTIVTSWFRDQQPDYLTKRYAWVTETRPLPPDEKLQQLKVALSRAERPVQDNPELIRLRTDVKHSMEQSANRRLTAAQDLTWALINNAAFLFNH